MTKLKGLFFDQDGVIVDTERDGHRVAFNKTFKEYDLPIHWDEATYGQLLKVGGGKERFKHYLEHDHTDLVPADKIDDLVIQVHKRKTDVFIELIESGQLPLRPGVKRLMQEANSAGLVLGICTTSNQRAAEAIINTMLTDVSLAFVLAGDVVSRKKPDPEIYQTACARSGLSPSECCAIEDSANGVKAATGAGLGVVVTVNAYTKDENHDSALLVLSCLGDPEGERGELIRGSGVLAYDGVLHADGIASLL